MNYLSLFISFCFICITSSSAQTINITGPVGSGQFGKHTQVLANGNYVVADPLYDEGGLNNIGAVYLYNGNTHTIISTLKGSANEDQIGSEGISALPNGNFVLQSQYWDNGAVVDAGAVTWGNGTTGINGVISATNSLVGGNANDKAGYYFGQRVQVLSNGNYLVRSVNWDNGAAVDAGAVTWGDGATGVSGVINAANSLVGSTSNDQVGYYGVYVLTNDNYVVSNPLWDNGGITNAGAVSWGNGTSGTSGVINATNSLVGTTANDNVGNMESSTRIILLANGNYVVISPDWDNGATTNVGAVTWCNGTTGLTGAVSATNSLTGSNSNDRVGYAQGLALSNGNYVVCSRQWRNGSFFNAGAVTWCNGATGLIGQVNTSNSLVGSKSNDFVGMAAAPLTNGNYVVQSSNWGNGINGAVGAATWCIGTAATSAVVSAANSLVGNSTADLVGEYITILSNGNYVVSSQNWSNGAAVQAGAATWGNGSTGTVGTVSSANSLVGSTSNDQVGYFGVTQLTNGNYVVKSPYWNNGAIADAGAATWGDGTIGITGTITVANSLVGINANDLIARNGINALSNGNYVISSVYWDNGAIADAGAITWGNGSTGISGSVSAANSIVGSSINDNLGNGGMTTLSNGAFVSHNRVWDNGTAADAGASVWHNGTTNTAGIISADNSLIGNNFSDEVGPGIIKLTNDVHAVISTGYGGTNNYGAVTWVNSNTGNYGYINGCNSILGTVNNSGNDFYNVKYNATYNYIILGKPLENTVTAFKPSEPTVGNHLDVLTLNVNATIPVDFINNNCRIIATLQPTGVGTAVKANTTARVWVDAVQNAEYVKRHYEITPTSNAATATGRVILYFTDADFNAFNTQVPAPNLLLPISTDGPVLINIRRQNLLIEKRPGITNNPATGAPSTYTGGTPITINPNDVDINWNPTLSRWEVAFDVTGFSGFFVKTISSILPVQWLNVTARLNNQQQSIINWQVQEEYTKTYQLEKSTDGIHFISIAITDSKGNGKNNYSYLDADAIQQKTFYRIVQTDNNGKKNYSEIVYVNPKTLAPVNLYPNPAAAWVTVNITNAGLLNSSVKIYSFDGKLIKTVILTSPVQKIDIQQLSAGLYQMYFANGSSLRLLKH
jgi:Repeat of unknown function (DUF5650)/Secretion system C-terminal sorting domain